MKNFSLIGLFISIIVQTLIGQISWERTPGPYSGNVNSIIEDHNGNLYAGTWLGGMYRMRAGESTWTHLEERLNFGGIWDIKVSEENVIYAASNAGIYQSSDQGNSWTLGNEGFSRPFCRSVSIYNADTIFAGNNSKGVYRSDDGGITWSQKSDSIGDAQIWVIEVTESKEIFVGTNIGIFQSDDKGETWEERNNGLDDLVVFDLLSSDSSHLYAGTFNGVYQSKDNGLNWEIVLSGNFYTLAEDDEGTIYAGYYKGLVISNDRFDSFEEYPFDEINRGISGLLYTSNDQLLMSTSGSGIYELKDSISLIPMNPGLTNVNIRSVVVDPLNNLFVGSNNGIFKSEDLGQTWTRAENGVTNNNIEGMIMANDTLLIAFTNGSGLYYSSDSGASWNEPDSGLPNSFIRSVASSPNGSLFAGSTNGEMFRSIDGGINWVKLNTSFPIAEVDVIGANAQGHIFAGLLDIGLYRSQDNGDNWIFTADGFPAIFRPRKFIFFSDSSIWMSGNFGIMRSLDNGDSWESLHPFIGANDLLMDLDGTIFAGTFGGVSQLKEANETWENVSDGLDHLIIESLALSSENILFAGSAGGGLFTTTIARSTTPIFPKEIPAGLTLSPIMPNPFKGTTAIQYNIPRSGYVSLKVYDMLGNEVANILDNQKRDQGLQKVIWNEFGNSRTIITPGVYVLTLTYDHRYTRSRNMIILK